MREVLLLYDAGSEVGKGGVDGSWVVTPEMLVNDDVSDSSEVQRDISS